MLLKEKTCCLMGKYLEQSFQHPDKFWLSLNKRVPKMSIFSLRYCRQIFLMEIVSIELIFPSDSSLKIKTDNHLQPLKNLSDLLIHGLVISNSLANTITQLKWFSEGWSLATSNYYIMYNKNCMLIKGKKLYFSFHKNLGKCHLQ